MKKSVLCFAVLLVLAVCSVLPVFAAMNYNNTNYANLYCNTTSGGETTVSLSYGGYDGITTGATVTTKIEKRFLGLFWKKIDIGTTNNEWVDEFVGAYGGTTHTVQLPSSGKYRVTAEFDVYGNNPTDHIEKTVQFEWNRSA